MGSLKNILFNICFLILFIKFCSSYTYFTPSSVHRNYPGRCWSNDTNRAYAPGESYQLYDKCEKVVCQRDLSFKGLGCGNMNSPDCILLPQGRALNQPYPNCCVRYDCDNYLR